MHASRHSIWTSCITFASLLTGAHCCGDETSRWDNPARGNSALQEAHASAEADTGFFFSASALYWTAYVTDLDYAIVVDDATSDYKHCKLGWRPGLRIEGGVCTGHDAWAIRGRWTAVTPRGRTSQSNVRRLINDLQLAVETEGLGDITEAEIRFGLDYDCLDFTLERPTFWSSSIAVSPFMGVRWLALAQKSRQDFSVESEDGELEVQAHWRSRLNGIGLLAGTSCDWHILRSLSLCGRGAASLLAGRTKDALNLDLDGNATLVPELADQKEAKWEPTPGYELSLGFQWENQLRSHIYLIARATYEFQHWFNLSRMRRFATPAVQSDGRSALLHGATATGELHF